MEARCAEKAQLKGKYINWSDREIKEVWTGPECGYSLVYRLNDDK